ncbi:MAG: 23S rRNA methyltransferase [Candidatus Muproteobacteria bacterium RBG_16_64_10]|uniref:Ribosomal RNA large subunit methyltransferase E n=1 Tax=Candidatus Muproteobacteria bacterium RBG_16_64_10 TaxID=1817757 RepID=A0A1F6T1K2_9PROT|nr:MAG: 23S rRNA methyltransferase [Candidatus Muproteobacteria bacterium RBG_16_64_10]
MPRSKSSGRWLDRQHRDPYVQKARKAGARSRAIFKLEELDRRDRLLKPGMTVVDLGAAPGGWSQYAAQRVGARGRVIALDILPMDPIPGVEVLEGDFTAEAVLREMESRLGARPADLVISDMAPNMTGIGITDQARSMMLAELALEFATQYLRTGGDFLVKTFQGAGFTEFLRELRGRFGEVLSRKPPASRSESREIYLLGKGFKGAVEPASGA